MKQGLFNKLQTVLLHVFNVLHLSLIKRHNLKKQYYKFTFGGVLVKDLPVLLD